MGDLANFIVTQPKSSDLRPLIGISKLRFNWLRITWFAFNTGTANRENANFSEKHSNLLLRFLHSAIIILLHFFTGYTNAFENAFNGTSPEIGKFAFAFYNGLFSYNGWWVDDGKSILSVVWFL